jgi:hypothetical protein
MCRELRVPILLVHADVDAKRTFWMAPTPPATIMYATDPPGENALVSVPDRGIAAVLRSVIYTVNMLMSVIVDVIYAPR